MCNSYLAILNTSTGGLPDHAHARAESGHVKQATSAVLQVLCYTFFLIYVVWVAGFDCEFYM